MVVVVPSRGRDNQLTMIFALRNGTNGNCCAKLPVLLGMATTIICYVIPFPITPLLPLYHVLVGDLFRDSFQWLSILQSFVIISPWLTILYMVVG